MALPGEEAGWYLESRSALDPRAPPCEESDQTLAIWAFLDAASMSRRLVSPIIPERPRIAGCPSLFTTSGDVETHDRTKRGR